MQVTSLPQVQGAHEGWRDGRYRIYTAEHIDFDALPSYSDGGPAKVAHDGWCVSYSSLSRAMSSASVIAADDGMHTLSIHRGAHYEQVDGETRYVAEYHPLDRTKYALQSDAQRAAFEGGATAFMVYERDAAKWGLPTE